MVNSNPHHKSGLRSVVPNDKAKQTHFEEKRGKFEWKYSRIDIYERKFEQD